MERNEKRLKQVRRTKEDRRKSKDPNYTGIEQRKVSDRRSRKDRRKSS